MARFFAISLCVAVGAACSSSNGGGAPGAAGAASTGSASTSSTGGARASASSSTTASAASGASSSSSSAAGSGGDSGVVSSMCTDADAAFTTSDPQGQWSDGGYFIRNDAWNTDAGPQTLTACSYRSWTVVANEPTTTDVKSYPDVQMDFQESGAQTGSGVPISSYHSITSTFAETSPHVGIYETPSTSSSGRTASSVPGRPRS